MDKEILKVERLDRYGASLGEFDTFDISEALKKQLLAKQQSFIILQ